MYIGAGPRTAKSKVIVVYGTHSINESIAKHAAQQLKNSLAARKLDMQMFEQPPGLCYVDAFMAAKGRTDPNTPDFLRTYEDEINKRTREACSSSYQLAEQNPDATVIDIHETPGLATYRYCNEGLGVITSEDVGEEELRDLNSRLKHVMPMGNSEKYTFPVHTTTSQAISPLRKPRNYIVIELITDPCLYEKLSGEETVVSFTSKERELRMPKKGERWRRLIELETAKYSRILDMALPVISRFMEEKRYVANQN